MPQYEKEYATIVDKINNHIEIGGQEVGEMIVKMAQFFGEAVGNLTSAEFCYTKKVVEFEQKTDDNGKQISSTKAESYSKATPEYLAYITAKWHVTVIEQQINSLKALQKGLSNEYLHQG
jgi:hypothetical protein